MGGTYISSWPCDQGATLRIWGRWGAVLAAQTYAPTGERAGGGVTKGHGVFFWLEGEAWTPVSFGR
jgi:hypothetical protein